MKGEYIVVLITIDGYCCQGKSTLGRRLAEELHLEFLSTGKIIRYVAYQFLRMQKEGLEEEEAIRRAVEFTKFRSIAQILQCEELQERETENALKLMADYPFVDEDIAAVVQQYGSGRDILLDGRFTFNIFPNAYRNYYLISPVELRVQFAMRSKQIGYEDALAYIEFRDSFEKHYSLPAFVQIIDLSTLNTIALLF